MPEEKPNKEVTGRAKGGKATAAKLTSEQRAERARKGALARWGSKMPVAIKRGNFMEQFGFDAECYVLDDANKTAVISQRGMGAALGLGEGGSKLPRFIGGKAISKYVGPELREKLEKPLIFQGPPAGPGLPPLQVHGYDVTVLIDLCKAIIQADEERGLQRNQERVARQAHVILGASAKAGIRGLVYALAGYRPEVEEVIQAFKIYVQQEAREYEKEFPPQLYEHWYRLYRLNKPERGRPWKAKFLTIDHVYHPLARSSGKILDLTRALKANSGDRNAKLHTFLSEVGVKALRTQLGQLLGIAGISKSAEEYERHVKTLFGDQPELPGMDLD